MSLYELLNKETNEVGGKIEGVVIGIVTNNQDPEGLGRVKVRFPARAGECESYWARIATMMAGKGRGSLFIPEVEDEVLVVFEQNNINHPYIIGCLWNGADPPPTSNKDGNNNIRMIQSRSGHKIVFNDDAKKKKEKIEIQTKAGHRIVLDDSAGAEKIEITDKTGKNSIVIDSVKNEISIESGLTLKIKSQMIEIDAGQTLTIKAGAILTIQGAIVKIN
jgi:uncharacterized protein involved in type VI secretion and phage assembly